MSLGRVLSASAAVLAVAGCTALAVGLARADSTPTASDSPTPSVAVPTPRPAYIATGGGYWDGDGAAAQVQLNATSSGTSPASRAASSSPRSTPSTAKTSTSNRIPAHPAAGAAPPAGPPVAPAPPVVSNPVSGQSLPLSFSTGDATRVITVTAGSSSSTVATLQAWTKAPGSGWFKWGSAVTAHVGSQGLTWHPSEELSATPIGSFTLTQAFGYYGNPGTALPYFQTNPDDYWISDKGSPYYNTHQRCGSCGYDDGINERLYYETPYYNYAVVIDANTRNAPGGVQYDHGSAFFLHVTDGNPTAGCVAIPQSRLVPLMQWLTPSAHPRILIGVV